MTTQSNPTLVTVIGGSGFLGRHVVRLLAASGYKIKVACRRPDLAGHLQPLGNVGQVQLIQANIRYPWSIARAVQGSDVVINLVGVSEKTGKQTFSALNFRGAGVVADAAKAIGARLIHVSDICAEQGGDYCQSRLNGEKAVRDILPDAIIIRPSLMFGDGDSFFSGIAGLIRATPVVPVMSGDIKIQPVFVADVAAVVVNAADGKLASGTPWELGGPETLTFDECVARLQEVTGRDRLTIPFPLKLGALAGWVGKFLTILPISSKHIECLSHDHVVSQEAEQAGHTLSGAGLHGQSLAAILPGYMVRFRKHGQFEARRGL